MSERFSVVERQRRVLGVQPLTSGSGGTRTYSLRSTSVRMCSVSPLPMLVTFYFTLFEYENFRDFSGECESLSLHCLKNAVQDFLPNFLSEVFAELSKRCDKLLER